MKGLLLVESPLNGKSELDKYKTFRVTYVSWKLWSYEILKALKGE
jgi:hypothetical protein